MFGSSSSSSRSNHIMNDMFEDELPRAREESFQMEFGGPSRPSDEQQQQQPNQCPKKRSYRRHTQEQIDELDA
ncbi:hypothetical protein TSUD_115880 [Trifolium subterraneum]|uniref:Uncharacterized protein n=1 Tax=Trifolium subterraneum TaxID=3900 RepID=A0A2Z6LY47_TRISU|nr:hypothetical protein TSUD_115880 [Trifolium subterraneum]